MSVTEHTDPNQQADPAEQFPWLGEEYGERALAWAAEQSAATDAAIDSPEHRAVVEAITGSLDAQDRIVGVAKHGSRYVNLWQDAQHPRGIWRSTSWDSYRSAETQWEILLDLDALSAAEGEEWVWAGAQWCPMPQGGEPTRVLLSLSPDGGDATRVREFDVELKDWAPGGFDLPLAKTQASWSGPDELLVSTVTGPQDSTRSSYARCLRRVRRGVPLDEAPVVFEVEAGHVAAWGGKDHTPGFERVMAEDAIDFYHSHRFLDRGNGWEPVEVPFDARVRYFREWLVVWTMSDWELEGHTHPAGSIVVANLDAWLDGSREARCVWSPGEGESLVSLSFTRSRAMMGVLKDVVSTVWFMDPNGDWALSKAPGVPAMSSVAVWPVDEEDPQCCEDYWMSSSGFVEPTRLWRGVLGSAPEPIAAAPERFDASAHGVSQHFATSQDGTRIPYFLVAPNGVPADGETPVLIHAYGGFRTSMTPSYSAAVGLAWLQRRTAAGRAPAYVVANLRGGGEYGPDWHTSALRQHRVRSFQDLEAVARHLHQSGLSSPALTSVIGRSNGGLLTGNALTRFPELFGAISCGVPLLDMLHYTRLSAGHSWIAEYGDPDDPADAPFLREMSPLHRLVDHPHPDYPPTLIWCTTSDDRVGPVQARMMAARMLHDGVDDVWYHEDTTGGHAGSIDHADTARMLARSYSFLWEACTTPERLHRG